MVANDAQKMTLRECKAYLSQLIEQYSEEHPITLTLEHHGIREVFNLVPRITKQRLHFIKTEIQTLSVAEIETETAPGIYMASEEFQLGPQVSVNYYGLFIDIDGQRDLRYFDSKTRCLDWLQKKIKGLANGSALHE